MQAYDHNLHKMAEPVQVEPGQIEKKAKELFDQGAKVIKVTGAQGNEILHRRDYKEKSRFLCSKYTPHQGSKEKARNLRGLIKESCQPA